MGGCFYNNNNVIIIFLLLLLLGAGVCRVVSECCGMTEGRGGGRDTSGWGWQWNFY